MLCSTQKAKTWGCTFGKHQHKLPVKSGLNSVRSILCKQNAGKRCCLLFFFQCRCIILHELCLELKLICLILRMCAMCIFSDVCSCFQVFAFSVSKDPVHWKLYDWSKVTTVVMFGYVNQSLMCLAHSHGVRAAFLGKNSSRICLL